MEIAKLPRTLLLLICTAGLPACSLLHVSGPCYGYGCPAGTEHADQKAAANAPAQASAPVASAQQQNSTSESANQTTSADASSHKHGLLAKLHLTHGD